MRDSRRRGVPQSRALFPPQELLAASDLDRVVAALMRQGSPPISHGRSSRKAHNSARFPEDRQCGQPVAFGFYHLGHDPALFAEVDGRKMPVLATDILAVVDEVGELDHLRV